MPAHALLLAFQTIGKLCLLSITYNDDIHRPCLAFIVNYTASFFTALLYCRLPLQSVSNSTVSATYIALGSWLILSSFSIAQCPACGSLRVDRASKYPTEQAEFNNTTSVVNAKQQLSKKSEQTSHLRISSSSSYHWILTQPMLQSRLPWMR